MTNLQVGSSEYRKLARQHAWLVWCKSRRILTRYEEDELQRISALMEQAELAYMGTKPIQAVADADDYAQLRVIGDLGGTELN
jgi:hypothetical protein